MSLEINCEVLYADALSAALSSTFPDSLDTNISQAMQTVINRILETARHLVPVRTGYLLNTIGSESLPKWSFTLYARAHYAGYVEWGTRRMYARLYMTHAIEQHESEFDDELANAVILSAEESGLNIE